MPTELQYTEQECIDALQRVADDVDGSLTGREYQRLHRDDEPSRTTVDDYFGSWNEAKDAAGLDVSTRAEYTKDELTEKLQELDDDVDGRLKLDHVRDANGYPAIDTFVRHFGSWDEAKEAAGLSTIQNTPARIVHEDGPVIATELPDNGMDFRVKVEHNIQVLNLNTSTPTKLGSLPAIYYVPTKHPFRDVIWTLLDNADRLREERSTEKVGQILASRLSGVRASVASKAVRAYFSNDDEPTVEQQTAVPADD